MVFQSLCGWLRFVFLAGKQAKNTKKGRARASLMLIAVSGEIWVSAYKSLIKIDLLEEALAAIKANMTPWFSDCIHSLLALNCDFKVS